MMVVNPKSAKLTASTQLASGPISLENATQNDEIKPICLKGHFEINNDPIFN